MGIRNDRSVIEAITFSAMIDAQIWVIWCI